MISLPIVGLQTDVGIIDVLAKVLKAGIIAGSVYAVLLMKKDKTITFTKEAKSISK